LEYTIKNHGKLTIDIAFGETGVGWLEGMPILSHLHDFSKLAIRIVDLLENL
jgi:hypothetical protein